MKPRDYIEICVNAHAEELPRIVAKVTSGATDDLDVLADVATFFACIEKMFAKSSATAMAHDMVANLGGLAGARLKSRAGARFNDVVRASSERHFRRLPHPSPPRSDCDCAACESTKAAP